MVGCGVRVGRTVATGVSVAIRDGFGVTVGSTTSGSTVALWPAVGDMVGVAVKVAGGVGVSVAGKGSTVAGVRAASSAPFTSASVA